MKLTSKSARRPPTCQPMPATDPQDRYQDLVEHSRDLICTHDPDGILLSMNPSPAKILGYEPAEMIGRNMQDFLVPECKPLFPAYLQTIRQTGTASGLMKVQTRSGEARIWEYNNSLRTEGVASPIVRGMAHDITERWWAESELRRSEEKFSTVFRTCPVGIAIARFSDGTFVDANKSFERMSGYQQDELVGRRTTEFGIWVRPEDCAPVRAMQLSHSPMEEREGFFVGKSGTMRLFSYSSELIHMHGEQYVLVFVDDVTERRAIERQLRQAQKMEALSLMASGCAHDFNNFLTGILGQTQLLKRDATLGHDAQERLSLIEEAALGARDLTARLHAIGEDRGPTRIPLDLNGQLRQLRHLLTSIVGEQVHLDLRLDPDVWAVRVDPAQFRQIVCNLSANGSEAMPRGGTLQIATRNTQISKERPGSNPLVEPGFYSVVSVTDTGCGMSNETAARVFEPFFTTKGRGSGRGLGLAGVYGIVKQVGGCISVQSEMGKGSKFDVYFPAAGEVAIFEPPASPHPAQCRPPKSTSTILVVDDSATVRRVAADILKAHGYDVLEASGSDDALRVARGHGERIDMLLTDLVMPGINGMELADRFLGARPGAKILFFSGYDGTKLARSMGKQLNHPLLMKPFQEAELLECVADSLRAVSQA